MYVRRGHGDSSLLPVGAVAPSGGGADETTKAAGSADGNTFHVGRAAGVPAGIADICDT